MPTISDIHNAMQPKLTDELTALEKLPKRAAPAPRSSWAIVNLWSDALELPNYFANQSEKRTLDVTYSHLHSRIEDLTKQVRELALPFDVAQREECRQMLQKEVNLTNEGIQELRKGIRLFAERTDDPTKAKQLEQELAGLSKEIGEAKSRLEVHFRKAAQLQHQYALAQQLRSTVLEFERESGEKGGVTISGLDKAKLEMARDILQTRNLPIEEFKKLVSEVNSVIPAESKLKSSMRVLFADMRRLDDPEALIPELARQKKVEMPASEVQQIVGGQLKKFLEQAFAHEDNDWHFISSPQPILNQRLSAEEVAVLEEVRQADLSKLPVATLLLRSNKAIELVAKGFGGTLPEDVAGTRNLLGVALKNLEGPVVEKKVSTDQLQQKRKGIVVDFGKVIDTAFACKTASGRAILEAKMLPPEREALRALKEKAPTMAEDPARLKAVIVNALDMIDRSFLSEDPPLRTVQKPAELAAMMSDVRAKLRTLG